jgi:glycosyltransferase involved in cell wall biosynthesis
MPSTEPLENAPSGSPAATPIPVLLMTRELGIGGCERDLAKLALGFDRAQFEPHVACFVSGGFRANELQKAGLPILELGIRSYRSWGCVQGLRRMARYIREHNIQVVHSLDVPANLVTAAVSVLRRAPVVLTSQLGARDLYDSYTHRLLRWTDRVTDLVVVNCDYQRQQLIAKEGVAARRIRICYNGVDRRDFHPAPDPATRRAVLPPAFQRASLVVGTIAALRPEKDLGVLIEAFSKVQHLREGMRLVIVGDGAMLAPWQAMAEQFNLKDACHFEPATANVLAWFQALDIFVMCSSSESFANSLLEAMACGCCSIATKVGGLPEMIADGEDGLLVEARNPAGLAAKLERVIVNDTLRETLGAKAAERAHGEFSVQTFVRTAQQIYLDQFRKARPDWR